MESIKIIRNEIKPIVHTTLFELTLQFRKFIIILIIEILSLIWFGYIEMYSGPSSFSENLPAFYNGRISEFYLIMIFAVSFFFSGTICTEFKNKTGLITFPLIRRYKLFIGKYLANLIYLLGLTLIYYLFIMLLGYNFYGEPIFSLWILSFGLSLLFIVALGSFVTFFSSFMPSPASVIIIICGFFLFFVESIINYSFMEMTGLEPLYSLTYLFQIIPAILSPQFPYNRYTFESTGNREYIIWFYPSLEGALIMLTLYTIISLLLALIIFKTKEMK